MDTILLILGQHDLPFGKEMTISQNLFFRMANAEKWLSVFSTKLVQGLSGLFMVGQFDQHYLKTRSMK